MQFCSRRSFFAHSRAALSVSFAAGLMSSLRSLPSILGPDRAACRAQGYTPDACMTDPMTQLQSIRMQAMWNAYRSSFSASGQAGAGVSLATAFQPASMSHNLSGVSSLVQEKLDGGV